MSLSTQPTESKIALVPKSRPSSIKQVEKWIILTTGTEPTLGRLGLRTQILVGKLLEVNYEIQCKVIKSKVAEDLAKCSSWHKGQVFIFKKERHGGLEEAAMRREKSWLKDMIVELKEAKQSRGNAFPNCFPSPSWNMYTHWYRWWPWSKMDMAHLSEPSILFHNMRWGGLRIF